MKTKPSVVILRNNSKSLTYGSAPLFWEFVDTVYGLTVEEASDLHGIDYSDIEEDEMTYYAMYDRLIERKYSPQTPFYITYVEEWPCGGDDSSEWDENHIYQILKNAENEGLTALLEDMKWKEWQLHHKYNFCSEDVEYRREARRLGWDPLPSYNIGIRLLKSYDTIPTREKINEDINGYIAEAVSRGLGYSLYNRIGAFPYRQRRESAVRKWLLSELQAEDYNGIFRFFRVPQSQVKPCYVIKSILELENFGMATANQVADFINGWETWLFETLQRRHQRSCSEKKRSSSHYKSEQLLREVLEEKFGAEFPSVWHNKIINPETGYRLELDCYNAEKGLAFEYNGAQHYEPVDFFGGEETYKKQLARDAHKRKRCKELGITLFEIDGRIFTSKVSNKRKQEIKKYVDQLNFPLQSSTKQELEAN